MSSETFSSRRNLWREWPVQPRSIAVAVGLLAFGIYFWQLSVPEILNLPDSGIYLAASIHLVSGVMPYRDFTFAQPPGITLLLAPVALLSRLIGTHDGLMVARVMSSAVTAFDVSLLAWLMRPRGRLAMLIAGIGLAVIPVSLFVSSGANLEPYCVCLILLGSLVVLGPTQSRMTPERQDLIVGGILFGLAAVVKLWAFFPFLAMVIALAPRCRRRVLIFMGASAASFLALCLPFFLAAPRNFLSEVLVEQVFRKATPYQASGLLARLTSMTGFGFTSIVPTVREIVAVVVILFLLVGSAFHQRLKVSATDAYLLFATLITGASLLAAPEYFNFYAYFLAPFVIGLFSTSLLRLGPSVRMIIDRWRLSRRFRRLMTWLLSAVGSTLTVAMVLYVTTFYTNLSWYYGTYGPYLAAITTQIPENSCVVYETTAFGIYANRFISNRPGCPSVVDPIGMWMAYGYRLIPPAPIFTREWETYFDHADYAVFNSPSAPAIPWDATLREWFSVNYHLKFGKDYVWIYKRN